MTRVESQVTRQALLVVGATMETDPPPEKLELFTEDGLAVDVGKDRTRARWRGEWVPIPAAPYEQNDFVMHDDKLYILSDFEAYDGSSPPPAAGWAIMTISAGMQFFGEWSAGEYKKQSIVTHDDMLWVAKDDIVALEFAHLGVSAGTIESGTFSLNVPDGTEVGDLLIWSAVVTSFSAWPKPAEGSWTTLIEEPTQSGSFPVGHLAVYAKIADEDDIGQAKTYVLGSSVSIVGHLRAFRGAALPISAQTDGVQVENTSYGGTLTCPAGTDPAETELADKVYRVFASQAQNFSYNSGLLPLWESSSDDNDSVITDNHNWLDLGSYWSEPSSSNPPDLIAYSGEHKYMARASIRLPSPSSWDESKWTVIGIVDSTILDRLAALEAEPDPGGFKGNYADGTVYPAGSIVRHAGATYGTAEEVEGIFPDAAPANFESVYAGVQAHTTDKLEDGVPRTFTWPDDATIDTGGSLTVPIAIHFVGSPANLNLHLVNALNSSASWLLDGSGAFGGGPYQSDEGSTQDRFVNFGTYYGGDGKYVLLARADSDAVGTLTVTATGADLHPPDPPNPWVEL